MINKNKYPGTFSHNRNIIIAFAVSIIIPVFSLLIFRNKPLLIVSIPLAILMTFLAITSVEKLLIFIVFLVPLSLQLRFILPEPPADLFIPTEIFLLLVLFITGFKILITKEISNKILYHPVTVICFIMLCWSLITSFTSTMVLVSLKNLLTKLWFIAGFYLLATVIFSNEKKIKVFFLSYISGMIPVVIWYLIRMGKAGIFNQAAAYKSVWPFFNDHTSFGAALAFCIPFLIMMVFDKETKKLLRLYSITLLPFFLAAFILSYSRAAWLSLILSAGFCLIVLLKISWRIIFPATVILIVILTLSWTDIMIRLNETRQESTNSITGHLQSVANIRTDASNMERLNRWKSAIRMFKEKPLLGWGPATFQFQYAPFQLASEKTIISTNYGEGGNAHSEYLGSLVDSGLPGFVFYFSLLITVIYLGWKNFQSTTYCNKRMLILTVMSALITYIVHGGLNNFLDTDKISALFWGSIAAIVAIDINVKEKGPELNISGKNTKGSMAYDRWSERSLTAF